jgi:hypothetical protein
MTIFFSSALLVLGLISFVYAQSQKDLENIDQLLETYRVSEDRGDHAMQGSVMTPDRVWVSNTTGRRIDNVENMRIQQVQADRRRKAIPGLQQINEDREKIIRFLAGGNVAVVTFYRHTNRVFPPGTLPELIKEYEPNDEWIMLVLEKQKDGKWLIVATHV